MKTVLKIVVGLFALLGVLVVAAGLFLRSLWNEPVPKQEQQQVERVADTGACECSNSAWCQGPQGGVYCLTTEGKKRYKPREQ